MSQEMWTVDIVVSVSVPKCYSPEDQEPGITEEVAKTIAQRELIECTQDGWFDSDVQVVVGKVLEIRSERR